MRSLKFWRVARKTLAQTPVQFRVAGLPQFVADVDATEINVAITEAKFHRGISAFSILHS